MADALNVASDLLCVVFVMCLYVYLPVLCAVKETASLWTSKFPKLNQIKFTFHYFVEEEHNLHRMNSEHILSFGQLKSLFANVWL